MEIIIQYLLVSRVSPESANHAHDYIPSFKHILTIQVKFQQQNKTKTNEQKNTKQNKKKICLPEILQKYGTEIHKNLIIVCDFCEWMSLPKALIVA